MAFNLTGALSPPQIQQAIVPAQPDPSAPLSANYSYATGKQESPSGKIGNRYLVNQLNAKVQSGEITQEEANRQYWQQQSDQELAQNQKGSALGNIVGSVAPVVTGGLLGGGVLGATGAQALGNTTLGRPVGENLANAGVADAIGAGAVGGTIAAGSGAGLAPEAAPELLGGPGVTSGDATTAAFGGGGSTIATDGAPAALSSQGTAATGLTTPAAAGTAAGAAAGGSVLSNLTGMDPTTAALLGIGASTGLGIYGANKQADAANNLSNRLFEAGQPSRDRFNASMSPGFDPTSIAGYKGALDTASESILRKLSATGGNPFGNPGGLIEANKQIVAGTALPAVQEYQRLNAGAGGFGQLAAGAPGAGANAVGAAGGVYNAIGSGISSLTNPQQDLAGTLRMLGLGRGGMSAA